LTWADRSSDLGLRLDQTVGDESKYSALPRRWKNSRRRIETRRSKMPAQISDKLCTSRILGGTIAPADIDCSLFSAQVFGLDKDGVYRKSTNWVQPVVVVPLIVFIFCIWQTWLRWSLNREKVECQVKKA